MRVCVCVNVYIVVLMYIIGLVQSKREMFGFM